MVGSAGLLYTVPLLTEFSCTKPKGKVAEVCLNVQIQWACDVLNTLGLELHEEAVAAAEGGAPQRSASACQAPAH